MAPPASAACVSADGLSGETSAGARALGGGGGGEGDGTGGELGGHSFLGTLRGRMIRGEVWQSFLHSSPSSFFSSASSFSAPSPESGLCGSRLKLS